MRILIVEDSEERMRFLRAQCKDHEVVEATTANDAIRHLDGGVFDLLFLDHDFEDLRRTGLDVAQHLRTLGREATPVIIHSMNLPAAKRMAALLPRSARCPFSMLKELASERTPAAWLEQCLAMATRDKRIDLLQQSA